jgi:TPR repeat protein
MSSPASALAICATCGEETSLVCAACLKTRFCSRPCAAKAWAGHRAACAEFAVLEALPDEALAPVPPAAPLASMESAAGADAGAFEHPGTGFECAVCGKGDAAVCARCRLVGNCGAEHQRKDWPTHKAVCRKGETRVVPVLSWEQRMLAEAHAAAPASLAATAALPPILGWNIDRDGAPPSKIMRAWRKAADGGHARAQFKLGVCYDFGEGVAKDALAAAEWYAKAAAQGLAAAQFNLGYHFKNGSGAAQDLKAAVSWYAKAAAQGHANAQHNLGVLYKNGTGVAQDFKAAAAWYAKAAAQGQVSAQHNLGACYWKGEGVSQDFEAAAALFAKAAVHGHAKSQFNLGGLYEDGTGVARDDKTAAEWYTKAAAAGDTDAPARRDACLARVAAAAAASRP